MSSRPAIPPGIVEGGVVGLARRLTPERAAAIVDGLLEGGVRAFEVTLDEPEAGALATLGTVGRHAEGTGLAVGAGTVTSVEAAGRAIDAGATFLVSPHTDADLVAWAAGRGVPALPGAFTPSEVLAGWRAGAAAIKLFPASVAGPRFVRELSGPFPDIPLLPTGGVTAENAPAFIRAGAIAVGMGSWLTGDGDPAAIAARARQIVRAIAEARAPRPR